MSSSKLESCRRLQLGCNAGCEHISMLQPTHRTVRVVKIPFRFDIVAVMSSLDLDFVRGWGNDVLAGFSVTSLVSLNECHE
jgi:hypothetical protein